MKKRLLICAIMLLLTLSCSFTGTQSSNSAQESPTELPQSEGRCGDGVCDGPENKNNCPDDCAGGMIVQQQAHNEETEEEEPHQEDPVPTEEVQDGYRRVSLTGTIDLTLNTARMGDFEGDAFEYAGDYSIELWFPMQGGQPVKQRNTITLTEYRDLYFGESDCRPCEWALDESAYEPVTFELNATLTLNGMQEDGQPVDMLEMQLAQVPMVTIGGTCTCPCPGAAPGPFSDPAAFSALTAWFSQGLTYPLEMNALREYETEDYPVSPIYSADIPNENVFYTIVSDFDQ